LKRAYRDILREAGPALAFVHLQLPEREAQQRVATRAAHFYPPSLVASQFEALEDPRGEPRVRAVDATRHVARLVEEAARWLRPAFNNA
jgi:gluconokinase